MPLSLTIPESYAASRALFAAGLDRVRAQWPGAQRVSHRLPGREDLAIDWIRADALECRDQLLTFTLGEHGIEAYVGAAMLQLCLAEALPQLDARRTGLLLVHAINPWGMQHRRRVNAGNVDLNRTFLPDPAAARRERNPGYERLEPFVNPRRPVRRSGWRDAWMLVRLAGYHLAWGRDAFRRAIWHGQYQYPHGIYYGGETAPEETRVLTELFLESLRAHRQVLHLDMHTGYGPRYQMSIVNSWMEPRDSMALAREFGYPLVVKTTQDEFYSIQGDMIDCLYALAKKECPDTRLYATSFEFGTYGDSWLAVLRSMRAVIRENQLHWHGAVDGRARERVERDFRELFWPSEERWWNKAAADARQALSGILQSEGYTIPVYKRGEKQQRRS